MLKPIDIIPNQITFDDSGLLTIARVKAGVQGHFNFNQSDYFLGVFLFIKPWALSVLLALMLVSGTNGGFL